MAYTDQKMSGGKIVWADARNGNDDVYLYNLDTDEEMAVTAGFETRRGPAINSDRVVWLTDAEGQVTLDLFEVPDSSAVNLAGDAGG